MLKNERGFGTIVRYFQQLLMFLALIVGLVPNLSSADYTKRMIIFYSSIGKGHISAAQAIAKRVQERSPNTFIQLKNIRDFMNPRWEKIDEDIFWYVVKNHPDTFTKMYNKAMASGTEVVRLEDLGDPYRLNEILAYIEREAPEVIISTHYGSAQSVGKLSEQGKLRGIKTGWLHTDYMVGYFPRISENVDRSFLPLKELEVEWKNYGIDPSKIETTGMPLPPELFEPIDGPAFRVSEGLSPTVKTITIASGGEGVGDFALIAKQLADKIPGPLQIVAICANNKDNYNALVKLKPLLRPDVKLVPLGFIPNARLLSFVKSSDLYITKAGGLSPTEAFAIGVPTLIMEIYGGHEAENAAKFEKLGLAVVNRNPQKIGDDAFAYLSNSDKIFSTLEAQSKFRDSLNTQAIVDFAVEAPNKVVKVTANLGRRGGQPVKLSARAIEQINQLAPSEIEILFSTAISPDAKFKSADANIFGHIAIRVGDDVYTVNQNANRDQDFLVKQSLHDYLYAVEHPVPTTEIGSHFGLAYSRDTYGIRLSGLSRDRIVGIMNEIQNIQEGWRAQAFEYSAVCNNCVDITQRIYSRTGLGPQPKKFTISMPLTTFSNILKEAEEEPAVSKQIVAYLRIPGADNYYRFNRFPVSIYKPLDWIKRRIGITPAESTPSWLTQRIAYILKAGAGDETLKLVKPIGSTPLRTDDWIASTEDALGKSYQEIKTQEAVLEQARKTLLADHSVAQVLKASEEEMKRVAAQNPGASNAARTGPPTALGDLQKRIETFEKAYDEYNRAKLRWIVEYYFHNTQKIYSEAHTRLNLADQRELRALYDQLAKFRDSYQTNEVIYNQPKDVKRIDAFRDFMTTQEKFIQRLNQIVDRSNLKGFSFARTLSQFTEKWNKFVKFLPVLKNFVPFLYNMKFNAITGQGSTPLVDNINSGFKALGDQLGFQVSVFGRENIPTTNDPKVLNFFVLQHSHPQLDNIVLANMGLESYAIYGAADTFMPKPMANMIDKSDHFIVVGRGSDKPVEKTLDILKRDKVRNFVIYPEGSVSVGMYDVRAPRSKFVTGLLGKLKAEGYQINLIPVSMPKNFRLNNSWMFPADPSLLKIEARIDPPISPEVTNFLVGSENEQVLSQLFRGFYFENLEKYSGRPFLGMPKIDDLLTAIDQSYGAEDCYPTLKFSPLKIPGRR